MKKYIKPTAEEQNITTQEILMTSPGYSEGGSVNKGEELSREQNNGWNGGLWDKKW